MFENMDFTAILKLGFVGIGFLLAGLAFLLLKTEQSKVSPRPKMLTPIYVFMGFSLILAGAALFLQTRNPDATVAEAISPYKNKLNKVSGLINGKLLHYLSDETNDEYAKEFAKNWKEEMEDAKAKGLID
ncbi:MAG: hypothetical protein JKX91_01940 [Rhizobiaceae bacterium]|nr:hypothetical protein [Rhizobiaceae bacterium]